MSTATNFPVAESKTINKSILAVGGVAALAFAAVLAFAPTSQALSLENVNLSTGVSSQDDDGSWSSLGLRLASQDDLENLGLGLMAQNVDDDESQSLGLGLEATDELENLTLNSEAATQDGDEWTNTGVNLGTEDNLENVWTDVHHMTADGDERSNFGIKFSFDE